MDHPPVLPVLASTAPRGRLMNTRPHDRVPSPTAAGNGCRLRGILEAGKVESVSESTPEGQCGRLFGYTVMRKLIFSRVPPPRYIAQRRHTACTALLPPFTDSRHAPSSLALLTGTHSQLFLV
jgi:hypothetical protein